MSSSANPLPPETHVIIEDALRPIPVVPPDPLPVALPDPLPVTLRRGNVEFVCLTLPSASQSDLDTFRNALNGYGATGWKLAGFAGTAAPYFVAILQREL
jgi:hypothetical protein